MPEIPERDNTNFRIHVMNNRDMTFDIGDDLTPQLAFPKVAATANNQEMVTSPT